MTDPIDVVVGMLRRKDGALLMTCRPEGKTYAGFWEFPGGKVEPHESAEAALVRELKEEIDVTVGQQKFGWLLEHHYAHAHVRLLFFWALDWAGQPRGAEGQRLLWVHPGDAWPYPVLPATVPFLSNIKSYTA